MGRGGGEGKGVRARAAAAAAPFAPPWPGHPVGRQSRPRAAAPPPRPGPSSPALNAPGPGPGPPPRAAPSRPACEGTPRPLGRRGHRRGFRAGRPARLPAPACRAGVRPALSSPSRGGRPSAAFGGAGSVSGWAGGGGGGGGGGGAGAWSPVPIYEPAVTHVRRMTQNQLFIINSYVG